MRVYDRNLTGASAAETGRSSETNKAGQAGESTHGSQAARSGDRVELSGTLEKLSRAMDTSGQQRASRVSALAALYSAGKYRAEPAAVSHAMVAEALMSGE